MQGVTDRKKEWPGFTAKQERCILLAISVTAALVVGILLLIYRYENKAVYLYSRYNFDSGALGDVLYNVESVTADEMNNSIVKGWFVKPGVAYDFYNYGNDVESSSVYNYLNFCFINDDKVYIFPTKLELRPDVNNYIGDGVDYKYAGFEAYVPSKYSYLFEECSFAFLSRDPAGVKTLYAEEEQP